jgi:hypothetical protein
MKQMGGLTQRYSKLEDLSMEFNPDAMEEWKTTFGITVS